MKVAVVNIKELFKYLVVIAIVCIILTITTNFFVLNPNKKINSINKNNNINNTTYNENLNKYKENKIVKKINIIKEKIVIFINTNNINKRTLLYLLPDIKLEKNNDTSAQDENINILNINRNNIIGKLMGLELSILDNNFNLTNKKENSENVLLENIEDTNTISNKEENIENINEEKNDLNDNIKNDIKKDEENLYSNTTVIKDKNLDEVYTTNIDGVKIKNQSSYEITYDLLDITDLKFDYAKNILIFHTHTCECYTKGENDIYEESGNFRTLDENFNVVRVGTELESNLLKYGYNIIHNKTFHDYPKYNGSYTRSFNTVSKILEENPNFNFVIDLHRDAIGSKADYAPKVKIGEENVAQVMFVLGTDGGGLYHPNWKKNLKYAVAIQKKANELYPGLFRPIILRNSRYNQQLASGAVIIEVGATGNNINECINSMKYVAKVISEVVK